MPSCKLTPYTGPTEEAPITTTIAFCSPIVPSAFSSTMMYLHFDDVPYRQSIIMYLIKSLCCIAELVACYEVERTCYLMYLCNVLCCLPLHHRTLLHITVIDSGNPVYVSKEFLIACYCGQQYICVICECLLPVCFHYLLSAVFSSSIPNQHYECPRVRIRPH